MKKRLTLSILISLLGVFSVKAQVTFDAQGNRTDPYGRKENTSSYGSDSIDKKTVPIGLYQWTIDERFGDICPAQVDTLSHLFQNTAFTEGMTGQYNTLGNLGSPRLSRLFMDRQDAIGSEHFIFSSPYDYFITQPQRFLFSNTKSPTTNLTYHECGNKQNGEDRIRAYFATNAGKKLGIGFKLDYLYGRGYYANQQTAHLNGSLFGSYISDNYTAHLLYAANYLKTAENGGIESDIYITNPESFPTNYGTQDIPTVLNKTWNKMHINTLFFTQRYSIGFKRTTDNKGNIISIEQKKDKKGAFMPDSLSLSKMLAKDVTTDSLKEKSLLTNKENLATDTTQLHTTFVPVTSFIHTMRIDQNSRTFLINADQKKYFTNSYYPADSTLDKTKNTLISNTFAIQMHEGFNKWAKAGLKAFFRHEFNHFSLPSDRYSFTSYNQNDFILGAQINKTKGRLLHYDLLGEIITSGEEWGEFNVEAKGNLNVPLGKDTLAVDLTAHIRNEMPAFYYEHYHAQHAWWDNTLRKEFHSRIEGELNYKRTNTRLRVGLENIKNYTFFAATQQAIGDKEEKYSNGVRVAQETKNLQVLSAMLNQNLNLGLLHWENEIAYQSTSSKSALPLPSLSLYSNLYLKFRIAKVLDVEFGGDVRYFSEYYAPTYSPTIGQFCTQADETKIKIGNYPIVNVYANFHMKDCRFYVMGSHINYSKEGGNSFLAPHYAINPMVIRFGISWTFDN
ncbi:MAG: putative porin [Bacteroidaceae bacterium]